MCVSTVLGLIDEVIGHGANVASCLSGGREIWWLVDAPDPDAALAQLPFFPATRATATEI